MILIFLHYVKNILQQRSCDHNLSCTANYNNELACIRTVSISYLVSKSSIVFKRTHRALKHTGFPISSKYVGTKVAAVTPPPFSYLPSINMNLLSQPGTELEWFWSTVDLFPDLDSTISTAWYQKALVCLSRGKTEYAVTMTASTVHSSCWQPILWHIFARWWATATVHCRCLLQENRFPTRSFQDHEFFPVSRCRSFW